MIPRSILWALGLFLLYSLLVLTSGSRWMRRAEAFYMRQNEFHKANLLRVQETVNTDLTGHDVYLGSSLGDRLPDTFFPRPFHKLCLMRGTPLTGLHLLEESGQRPRRVFIESNYLLTRHPDRPLLEKTTGWRGWGLARVIPLFRIAYRPADLFVIAFFGPRVPPTLTDAAWEERRCELLAVPNSPDDSLVDAAHVRKMKDLWKHEFESQPDPQDGVLLDELTRTVRALEKRGVRVVFFHMPMDADVVATGRYPRNQAMLASRFPPDRYRWIQPAPDYQYLTIDGFHLTIPSGCAYARYLVMSSP